MTLYNICVLLTGDKSWGTDGMPLTLSLSLGNMGYDKVLTEEKGTQGTLRGHQVIGNIFMLV